MTWITPTCVRHHRVHSGRMASRQRTLVRTAVRERADGPPPPSHHAHLVLHPMAWYLVLIPAALAAVIIRVDSVYVGPYWTFTEVVPGMGTDVDWWYAQPRLRWAIVRRYSYAALPGAFLSVYDHQLATADVALVGVVLAGLLLWPLLFHGLPIGVAPRDWQLVPLYIGVVASFTAAPVVGSLLVDYVQEQSGGDVVGWLKDETFDIIFWPLLLLVGSALFRGSYSSLRERNRRREEAEYHDTTRGTHE